MRPPVESLSALECLEKAVSLRDAGNIKDALRYFWRAQSLIPASQEGESAHQFGDIYFERGVLYDWVGCYIKAVADFEACIKLNSDMMKAFLYAAISSEKMGDIESAQRYYNEAVQIEPHPDALNLRAMFHHKLKNYQEALEDSSRVLSMNENNAFAWIIRGDTHKYMGSQQDALQDYAQALDLDASGARRWIGKGFKCEKISDFTDIIQQYVTCLRVRPLTGVVAEDLDISEWDADDGLDKENTPAEITAPVSPIQVKEEPRNEISRCPSNAKVNSHNSDYINTGRTYGSRVSITSTKLSWEASRNYRRPWAEPSNPEKPRRPPSAPFTRSHTKDYEAIRKRLRPKTAPAKVFDKKPAKPAPKKTTRQSRTPSPTNARVLNMQSNERDQKQVPRRSRASVAPKPPMKPRLNPSISPSRIQSADTDTTTRLGVNDDEKNALGESEEKFLLETRQTEDNHPTVTRASQSAPSQGASRRSMSSRNPTPTTSGRSSSMSTKSTTGLAKQGSAEETDGTLKPPTAPKGKLTKRASKTPDSTRNVSPTKSLRSDSRSSSHSKKQSRALPKYPKPNTAGSSSSTSTNQRRTSLSKEGDGTGHISQSAVSVPIGPHQLIKLKRGQKLGTESVLSSISSAIETETTNGPQHTTQEQLEPAHFPSNKFAKEDSDMPAIKNEQSNVLPPIHSSPLMASSGLRPIKHVTYNAQSRESPLSNKQVPPLSIQLEATVRTSTDMPFQFLTLNSARSPRLTNHSPRTIAHPPTGALSARDTRPSPSSAHHMGPLTKPYRLETLQNETDPPHERFTDSDLRESSKFARKHRAGWAAVHEDNEPDTRSSRGGVEGLTETSSGRRSRESNRSASPFANSSERGQKRDIDGERHRHEKDYVPSSSSLHNSAPLFFVPT